MHALDVIESEYGTVDWVLAPQVTSPIRSPEDISEAIQMVESDQYDSIFSVVPVTDFFMWKKQDTGQINSINYDYHNRNLRQNISTTYLENGSFYLFRPSVIRENNNRLGGRIGMFVMTRYKMFQIDNKEEFKLCEVIMKGYGLA
jgi:N-acylneuraminate cytidylyltransferase